MSQGKSESEDEEDKRNPFNNMMYVGKSIPSKTFLKLQRNIKKKEINGKHKSNVLYFR